MRLREQYFGATADLVTSRRIGLQISNAKRNARLRCRLTGVLTTNDGTGTVTAIKGGTLRNAVLLDVNNNGDDLFQQVSAAYYAHISEFDAQQPLAAARVSGSVADGAHTLYEEFTIEFSRPRQAIPRETAFIESQMNSPLLVEAQLLQDAAERIVAITGDATATLADVQLEVEQEYSDLIGSPLPLFRPQLETSTFPLPANATSVRMELRLPARTSDLIIACLDSDNQVIADETGIASLALRGSGANQDIIGPTPTPFELLLQKQRELASGDVDVVPGIYQHCFQPHGELSDTLNPNEFQNLALYVNGGSAGGTVIVLSRTLNRPRPLRPDALVVVPDADLPAVFAGGWVVPAILAVAQVAGTAAKSSAVQAFGDAIAGLFGSSAVDKARRAEVQSLFARAADGDGGAFRQLEFIAFEKRTGQPGDLRPAVADGSASPPASRDAAKKGLKALVAQGRTLSKESYYQALGVPVPQSFVQRVVGAAAGQVADSARPVVQQEISGALRQALPYIVAAFLAVGFGAYALARTARK